MLPPKEKPKYFCPTCGKDFATKDGLNYHELRHHPTEPEEPIKCEKCPYIAPNKFVMKTHKMKYHKEQCTVNCEYCGMTFRNNHSLVIHQKRKHVKAEDLVNIPCHCKKCEEKFQNASELNQHLEKCLKGAELKQIQCIFCKTQKWHSDIALGVYNLHQATRFLQGVC